MDTALTHGRLHCTILAHVIEDGHPPSIEALAERLQAPRDRVEAALVALQDYHGVVLHPLSREIWAVHPFSAAPSLFWVETPAGRWWGCCAWCSLGIIALAGGRGSITTTLGGESRQVTVTLDEAGVSPPGLLVHFPIPMARAWDNVIYTCSNMLLFDSTKAVDDWCMRHGVPRGDAQPLELVRDFAAAWYGRHLDPGWVKWSAADARGIFERFNLTGPTWSIAPTDERF